MKTLILVFSILLLYGCKEVPKKKHRQFEHNTSYEIRNDSLIIRLHNPLMCPLSLKATSANDRIDKLIKGHFPVVIPPVFDTTFTYPINYSIEDVEIKFNWTFGDPDAEVTLHPITLPFPGNKSYSIIQGYNGNYSH